MDVIDDCIVGECLSWKGRSMKPGCCRYFTTDADGSGRLEQTLENDLSNYNQLILTVEPEPDDSPALAPKHSIDSDLF